MISKNILCFLCFFVATLFAPFCAFAFEDYTNPIIDSDYSNTPGFVSAADYTDKNAGETDDDPDCTSDHHVLEKRLTSCVRQ